MKRAGVLEMIQSVAGAGLARLGAWLGVLALVAQLLLPLSQPQVAWAEEGLFPPTCSIHLGDDGSTGVPGNWDCAQCPLCQMHVADRVVPVVDRSVEAAFASFQPVVFHDYGPTAPPRAVARPPLPSRGPPSVA